MPRMTKHVSKAGKVDPGEVLFCEIVKNFIPGVVVGVVVGGGGVAVKNKQRYKYSSTTPYYSSTIKLSRIERQSS